MKAETTAGIAAKTLQRSKAAVAAMLVATLGAVLLSLLPPQLLRLIIDRNLSRGVSDGLQTLAACYLAVVVLLGAFNFFKGVLLSVLGQRIIKELRIELHRKLQR
ncbi:MAG: ABC transporter transmembrane domain-containing protein, partial [Pygmaiobacter sp.]